MSRNSLRLQERLHDLGAIFASHGVDIGTATQQGTALLASQVRQSATVMAYADSFWILGVCIVVSLATLLILRRAAEGRPRSPPTHTETLSIHRRQQSLVFGIGPAEFASFA